jgi:hypothetical protein
LNATDVGCSNIFAAGDLVGSSPYPSELCVISQPVNRLTTMSKQGTGRKQEVEDSYKSDTFFSITCGNFWEWKEDSLALFFCIIFQISFGFRLNILIKKCL